MKLTIGKQFRFSASHQLLSLHAEHKCRRLHGHSYFVDVVLEGDVDERGMVMDFEEVAKAWAPLFTMLDHHHLNDIEGLEMPSAERVAGSFQAITSEIQTLARACGKSDVHHLEPEDLRALTAEASMITGVPLAGTNRVVGGGPGW